LQIADYEWAIGDWRLTDRRLAIEIAESERNGASDEARAQ
jgi:hypothetical protein